MNRHDIADSGIAGGRARGAPRRAGEAEARAWQGRGSGADRRHAPPSTFRQLAPVTEGRIAAEASLVARTGRVAVLEARVQADGDRLVALATGSFYIQTPR